MAQQTDEQWELVRTTRTQWEAEILQGFLESNGVATLVTADDSVGGPPHAILPGGFRLQVRREDLGAARELIAVGGMSLLEAQPEVRQARLSELLVELLEVPSPSGETTLLADQLEDRFGQVNEEIQRANDSLLVGTEDYERPNVLLVAHLDTVPVTGADRRPHRESDRIVGRGASDAKSGLAVAIDCFEDVDLRSGPHNVMLLAHAGRGGPGQSQGLEELIADVPEIGDADLAVILDPTDCTVQLGCLGFVDADVVFRGRGGHSARPWTADNALTAAGALLAALHEWESAVVEVGGLEYREALTAVHLDLSGSGVDIPDHCVVRLRATFPPDRTVAEGERALREILSRYGEVRVTDTGPGVHPERHHPMVEALCEAVDAPVLGTQAHTVASLLEAAGVATVHFGPGLAAQAHRSGEHVPEGNLLRVRDALGGFLSSRR